MIIKKAKISKQIFLVSLFLSLLIQSDSLSGQNKPEFFELEERVGYIVKNYPVFPALRGPTNMWSFRMGKQLNGFRMWHRYYRFPYIGVDFTGGYMSNKKVLGSLFGISPEMMFSHKISSRWYVAEILGIGLAWFSHPYDINNNPQNTLIGSRITALPHAALGIQYFVSPFLSLWLRASAYHASNCHYQLPNLGVNISSVSLAVRYHPRPAQIMVKEQGDFKTNKKVRFNLRMGFGINERGASTGPVGGPKRITYISQIYLTKNLGPVSKLQGGIELNYSNGIYDTIIQSEFYNKHQRLRAGTAVFFLGHEFLMGHFSLALQGGIYMYNPYGRELAKREKLADTKEKLKTLFVARLGFQYYFKNIVIHNKNQLFAGVYVKTNFGQADYLDLGLGYMF